MGNPFLRPDAVPFNDRVAPPVSGQRGPCATCQRCLGVRHANGRAWTALCSWQGQFDWPDDGCDRFVREPGSDDGA